MGGLGLQWFEAGLRFPATDGSQAVTVRESQTTDKALARQLCAKESPHRDRKQRNSKGLIRRRKSRVHAVSIDTEAGSERGSNQTMRYFEPLLGTISSGFTLTNPLALPDSEAIIRVSQDPPMYTCIS